MTHCYFISNFYNKQTEPTDTFILFIIIFRDKLTWWENIMYHFLCSMDAHAHDLGMLRPIKLLTETKKFFRTYLWGVSQSLGRTTYPRVIGLIPGFSWLHVKVSLDNTLKQVRSVFRNTCVPKRVHAITSKIYMAKPEK